MIKILLKHRGQGDRVCIFCHDIPCKGEDRTCLKKIGLLKKNRVIFYLGILLIISLILRFLFANKAQAKDSPHFFIDDAKVEADLVESQCKKCHIQIPELEGDEMASLRQDYENTCLACHPRIPQSCNLIISPRIYNILRIQIREFPLPVFLGRVTCASCHWTHKEKKRETTRLREAYKKAGL